MADVKEQPKRIHDVDVNRDALKKASNLEDFKKANPNIFNHLGDKENAAYEELFKEVGASASIAPAAVKPVAPSGPGPVGGQQ